jgi:hypothetical protein
VRELPILFSGPLVRAILEGRKTQTRRIFRFPTKCDPDYFEGWRDGSAYWNAMAQEIPVIPCPFGTAGDRLYVRETWAYFGGDEYLYQREPKSVAYRASFRPEPGQGIDYIPGGRWRPSIHMPRWASRLTLGVTDVRVERLQDISEEDARAEGLPLNTVMPERWTPDDGWLTPAGLDHVERFPDQDCGEDLCVRHRGRPELAYVFSAREALALWWDHINGHREGASWEANPWVWCVTFRRVEVPRG